MNDQVCQTHPYRGLERCHLEQFVGGGRGRIFGCQSVPALLGEFRLGRTISSLSGHSSQGTWSLLVAGWGRGQDLMVIPLLWDTGVRAPPLSEYTIPLLQHWPRVHKHPSSFPWEESHFLLIPVISCNLRQAPFGPKRELGKDFNLQTALFLRRDLPSWALKTPAVLLALWG